jgi:thiosulfate/3-mercaptopyruvate sulfurtransferase
MIVQRPIRSAVLGAVLVLALAWSLALGADETPGYPNADLLASVDWLAENADASDLVIVDVRTDEHFDGAVIPGAVRMPWSLFREIDPMLGAAGMFVGVPRAERLLGEHGIAREDTVVIYDSVERDGGATASYVFWILDMLGHERVRILEGGIDAWKRAGRETTSEPATPEPVLYQAPPEELESSAHIDGSAIYKHLGEPYFQILDVRSRDEYLGEAPNPDWRGRALKLGHIPSAHCVPYESNWRDTEKPYTELQSLYPGLNPNRAVVVYCHSGRRSSFTYFALRLMGFDDVRLYDASWNEWGKKSLFYPVETAENVLSGPLPGAGGSAASGAKQQTQKQTTSTAGGDGLTGGKQTSGYISCGG